MNVRNLFFVLAIPAVALAQTASMGTLRGSSPVVTNEQDAAFLEWRDGNHILLGANAATADPDAPWPYNDIAIGADSVTSEGGVAIGNSATSSVFAVALGAHAAANPQTVAIGRNSRAGGTDATAIGYGAVAAGNRSVQIGPGRNEEADTLKVRDYTLLDARGIIPPARLGSMPMRAALFSGGAIAAAPETFLYWCTNVAWQAAPGHRFAVSADLPDDSDAMQWDLWISADSAGFSPDWISGVSWVGPYGPPDTAMVAPGETLMIHCTAVRSPDGDTLVLGEYRGTVAVNPAGSTALPPRTAGRVRVAAADGGAVRADGGADVYVATIGAAGDFGVTATLPYGADGIAYEVWLTNAASSNITPVAIAAGCPSVLGALPSVPSGGRCILRCRSVRDGVGVATVATVEGVTPSGGLGSALLAAPLALPPGDGGDETDDGEEEETR